MVISDRPPANAFVKSVRKIYNPIGFTKGYNFILWFIFGGAIMGFTLARFQFLSFSGKFCNLKSTTGAAAPGECFYYANITRYHVGILVHLATILPASFLVVFQFVPAIRHRFLIYHRVAGYVIILLVLTSIGAAIAIADHSFGGNIATQAGVGVLGIASATGICLAYYNIKRLQIDQHRAWMLRVWFWMASIITLRLIQICSAVIISKYHSGWYTTMPCAELAYIANETGRPLKSLYAQYPVCAPNANLSIDNIAVVKAQYKGSPEQIGASLGISFGMAMWLALFIHAAGIEIYLKLTPREGERLRNVSYQRQLEAGMRNSGSAGLVLEKFGDMDAWEPAERSRERSEEGVKPGSVSR